MEVPIIAAIITGGATLITALLAAGMIVFQLGRQSRNALAQSAHTERVKLKLQIYEDILGTCSAQSEAELALSSPIRQLRWACLPCWREPAKFGGYVPVAQTTVQELMRLQSAASEEAIKIVILTEQWRIVEPRLDVFQLAMNVALHDVRVRWDAFWQAAAPVLPPVNVNPQTGIWTPPDDAALAQLQEQCDLVLDALGTMSMYVSDFQVEMQNLLLADLFGHKVEHRKPIDPRKFVVRLDERDSLVRRFKRDSAWGRLEQETNERVRNRLAAADDSRSSEDAGSAQAGD